MSQAPYYKFHAHQLISLFARALAREGNTNTKKISFFSSITCEEKLRHSKFKKFP